MVGFYGTTAMELENTLGRYTYTDKKGRTHNYKDAPSNLSAEGQKELFKGISEYEKLHHEEVKRYKQSQDPTLSDNALKYTLNDPKFFRKKLIEYIDKRNLPSFNGDPNVRKTNPEAATVSMEELLGTEGVKLYKWALEEELNSREYRHALLAKSTLHFDGPKWTERPVVIVAGPSACGKSFAAETAVETANRFLPSNESDVSGNNVVAADGGLCRETSQMRKMMVQVATNQGYTGIIDLHKKSGILDEAKTRVQDAAFATPDLGVVIPETFKGWFTNPRDPANSLMEKIDKLPNTKQIFTRVEGEDLDTFKQTVAFMGSRRAWKVDDFTPKKVDLNNTDISESKAYIPGGFFFGRQGSRLAERWYRHHSKDKLSMIITNDLILLRPDPQQPNQWIPAKQGEEGTLKFSRHAYAAWTQLPNDPHKPNLVDYCKTHAKPIIETSAQIDFAIAQKEIAQRIKYTEKRIEKENLHIFRDETKVDYLFRKRNALLEFAQIKIHDLTNQTDIALVKRKISDYASLLHEEKKNCGVNASFSATLDVLEHMVSALSKAELELKGAQPILSDTEVNAAAQMRAEMQEMRDNEDNFFAPTF